MRFSLLGGFHYDASTHINDTTYQAAYGYYWGRIFPEAVAALVGQRPIIVYLSIQVFWIMRTGAPWRDLPERFGRLEQYAAPLYSLPPCKYDVSIFGQK